MSEYIKTTGNAFPAITIILVFSVLLSSCQLSRYVFYNFADVNDHKKFPSRPLHNDSGRFLFSTTVEGKAPDSILNEKKEAVTFDQYLESNKTVAFLIIKSDTIQYEKYFKGFDRASVVPSFSIAKSVISLLIGCAIDDGLIKSVDEPITNYLPELKKNGFEKVTIKHLLQMTSGIRFNESYFNPFSDAASFYYGRNLRKKVSRMKLKAEQGTEFKYISGNTQILGLVLESALKTKTVTQYLQERIWQPLGMEYDASWSLDKKKNGIEKTFCCINACARDYAKIGRLYLEKGNWNGKQIVSESWVKESTKIDSADGSVWYYQYQWWIPSLSGDFMAEGILGQFIYVNPKKDLIIVRLGKKEGKINWWHFLPSTAALYRTIKVVY